MAAAGRQQSTGTKLKDLAWKAIEAAKEEKEEEELATNLIAFAEFILFLFVFWGFLFAAFLFFLFNASFRAATKFMSAGCVHESMYVCVCVLFA